MNTAIDIIMYEFCCDFWNKNFVYITAAESKVLHKVNRFNSCSLMTHFGSDKSLMRHGLLFNDGGNEWLQFLFGTSNWIKCTCLFEVLLCNM